MFSLKNRTSFKKVLALVLVVAMMASFAVTASAADFTDDSAINNQEAVSVMTLVEVIKGKTDGSFDPAGNVTRAEMAKMITTILNKGKDVNTMYAASNKFTDCKGHWAAGYISYAAAKEIVNGVGAGKFDPNGLVTGAQAAKMVLGMIGYNAENEGYTGAKWDVPTVADADRLGLLAGLEDVVMDAPLNRESAAQMLFNAFECTVMYFNEDGINIDSSDLSLTTKGTYTVAKDKNDEVLDVQDVYFAKLSKTPDVDAFGAPATKYTYNKESVTFADEAALTFVADEQYKDEEALKDKVYDLVGEDTYVYETVDYTKNGNDFTMGTVNKGDVVEVYVNDDDVVTDVVIHNYTMAKIEKITAAASSADYDYVISTSNGTYKDTDMAGFSTDWEVDDVLSIVQKSKTVALSAELATVVTGEVTRVKDDAITVGGTVYTVLAGEKTNFDDTYNFYLDANGYVIGNAVETAADAELAYLYVSATEVKGANNGVTSADASAAARVTFTDGTEEVIDLYVVKAENGDKVGTTDVTAETEGWYYIDKAGKGVKIDDQDESSSEFTLDAWYTYEIKDDMYVLNLLGESYTADDSADVYTAATLTVKEGKAAVTAGGEAYVANSATALTFIKDGEATTYTGIASFPNHEIEADGKVLVITGDGNKSVTNIYVMGDSAVAEEVEYIYMAEKLGETTDGELWSYYIDGELKEAITSATNRAVGLFEATFEDGKITKLVNTKVGYATVVDVDDTYFTVEAGENDTIYYVDSDTAMYNVSGDFTGEATTLSVGDVVAFGATKEDDVYTAADVYIIDAPEVTSIKENKELSIDQIGAEIIVTGNVSSATTTLTVTVDKVDYTVEMVTETDEYTVFVGGIALTIDTAGLIF